MGDIFDTKFEGKAVEIKDNKLLLGEDLNITAKDPTMRRVHVGVGWDLNTFDADSLDVDVCAFLIGKTGETRVDEDFVFYNNPETMDGAVRHNGDSRTGAGDGDDESILIDLHGVPFDVFKIMFVVSIYKAAEKSQSLTQVRNSYIRIANAETMHELARFEMSSHFDDRPESAVIAAALNREGPKWHFKPMCEFVEGGLAAVAKRYGLIIQQQ
jgi:tellurium resistance protein TerD